MHHLPSVDEAIAQSLLPKADIYLLGPAVVNPVKEVQKLASADAHLAVILLALPAQIRSIKQSIQFAPFVGKNTLVIALGPELDLTAICRGAVQRTRQRRSFYQLAHHEKSVTVLPRKIMPEQLGTFLDYAPIGALLLNEANGVVTYNEQAKKLFPSLLVAGAELSHLFSIDVEKAVREFIHDGHHPEQRREFIIQQKIMEVTSSEVYNEEGGKHFLLLFNDVTEQRLEGKRIQAVLEALPQMAWTTNADGKVTYFTQGWYYYTGQTTREAIGTGWTSAVHADDRTNMLAHWKTSASIGKPFQQAARYRDANGGYRWHLTRASAIKNGAGQITMWVGTCTDIHDQILLTEELERKVAERTRSLQVSNSELEQFAHVSSHDLQEPLRKIRTFAELIKEAGYESLDAASQKYIDKISSTAERMSASLKALLNFTKLHREEKFSPVDLNETVVQVMVDLELAIAQKGAVITVGPLPQLKAIPIQMQQLFYNLLNNALKFTRKDVPPQVAITARRLLEEELLLHPGLNRYKEYHEIVVKDNGVGFDQQYAEKIFTIFQRLHNKAEYEGTGIGLSLVKKVVNNHKGEIRAVSNPGEGTAFYLLLPA